MMENGPDQKRPRLAGPAPPQWQNPPDRQLPPPPAAQHPSSYSQHASPFSRPEPPVHSPLDHRRPSSHTEQHSSYDPQDSRRPQSGPSLVYNHHPHASPHPPPLSYTGQREGLSRDPMVKRDPSDEQSQPQSHFRPSPTQNAPQDHNVSHSPHHEGRPPQYHLPPFEHPPGAPFRNNSYPPPQSPLSAGAEQYHSGYVNHGLPTARQEQYPSVSYPAAPASSRNGPDMKRKPTRAAQACDSCRTLKAKCDEGRPSCSSCREKNVPCHYRDPPPKQQDKTSVDMMESLQRIESVVTSLGSQFAEFSGHFAQELSGIKEIQESLLRHVPEAKVALKEEARDPAHVSAYQRASISSEAPPLAPTDSSYSSTPVQQPAQEPVTTMHTEEVSEEDEDGGDPGPPGAPSIPVNHTTGAARMLFIPTIAEMIAPLQKSHKAIKNDKYPIVQEGKRGLLRLFGRGEGTDAPPGYEKDNLNDHGSNSTPGDNQSDASSPAPAGEEWGQMGGLTPPGNPPPEFLRGGINQEGMPDLSRETVLDLVKSYKENINNMHPILLPSRLDAMVDNFLKHLPESQAKPKQVSTLVHGSNTVVAGFVGGHRNPESPGQKRKRSPAGETQEPSFFWDQHKPGHPFRNISSALVLLVMALGRVCQQKGKIPDVAPEKDPADHGSPNIRNGHPPSPLQSSPSLSTLPSPLDPNQPRSRRTSIEGALPTRTVGSTKPKNIDVIPGLVYFAFATDVIGNQLGGNSLQHVHANILAGLYQGQLARVMESHSYIHQACRGLQVILRPKLDRFRNIKKKFLTVPAKDNPLVFAFWTCLQLESDIVAELPCPHSGILTYEEDMPGPNLQAACDIDGFPRLIIESYAAQLFLRKHLNALHNMFYKPEPDNQYPFGSATNQQSHFVTIAASEDSLKSMDVIAPNMKWDQESIHSELATDILHARLRAKYYGAKVITYRHFVLRILRRSAAKSRPPGEQIAEEFKHEIDVPDVQANLTSIDEIEPKAIEYAIKCIRALINSTRAFHGLGDPGERRLIVTNIWGTAHAQWGNLLLLQAIYMDPILKPVLLDQIKVEDLKNLLEATIGFLGLVSQPSSALAIDLKILKHISNCTGLRASHLQGLNTSSSFSSSNTGDVPMTGN